MVAFAGLDRPGATGQTERAGVEAQALIDGTRTCRLEREALASHPFCLVLGNDIADIRGVVSESGDQGPQPSSAAYLGAASRRTLATVSQEGPFTPDTRALGACFSAGTSSRQKHDEQGSLSAIRRCRSDTKAQSDLCRLEGVAIKVADGTEPQRRQIPEWSPRSVSSTQRIGNLHRAFSHRWRACQMGTSTR